MALHAHVSPTMFNLRGYSSSRVLLRASRNLPYLPSKVSNFSQWNGHLFARCYCVMSHRWTLFSLDRELSLCDWPEKCRSKGQSKCTEQTSPCSMHHPMSSSLMAGFSALAPSIIMSHIGCRCLWWPSPASFTVVTMVFRSLRMDSLEVMLQQCVKVFTCVWLFGLGF